MMDQPMDLCEKVSDQTVDLCEKGNGSGSGSGSDENSTNIKKTCADCKTTKTPLWRGGPEGPKSLCNACGIRHRKKRRALLGLSEENNKRKERRSGGGVSLKLKLVGVKREVVFNTSDLEKHMKMGEEEQQAAFLLMALSCGSVYG